ncbi:MAG: tRNA (adenosine(37)-N6)-threonylcarbamoyltransferase complex ATPase subunit type 1 TsaE [Bacteroidia bacterium]|nr:tRNA (adenosine(37)-N6)-threonylcarbamoyltransferase complex ATPase subunit type 1 TsaE [Bacteroidia bacterium]MCZ2277793.1 tRNA (adenosine(37)-N6)-threonylcarbamoyltransferase complex ATPase subunit type 1 TsaE [Bacteroidia bacterium]
MSSRQPTSDLTSKFTSQCPDDLIHPATYIIKHSEQHKVVAFYGQLGAGKTTLIKVICKMLGTEDVLSSPTFSIVNEYRLTGGNPIFHLDFYRIKSQQEAFDLGYEQYLFSNYYCFIEWPEKISNLLPPDCMKVFIDVSGNQRTITIQQHE